MTADQRYYLLRRLHSLTGIVPVGVFLLQHIYANALAMWGAKTYNEHVDFILTQPLLPLMEWGGIFLPLALHAVLGLMYTFDSRQNIGHYGYQRNWLYWLQRVTGLVTFAYIIFHLATTRFSFSEEQKAHMYESMVAQFSANPWMVWAYIVGVLASCFHFANGLWGFCIMWGITVTRKSQKIVWLHAMALFVILSAGGIVSALKLGGCITHEFSDPHHQLDNTRLVAAAEAEVKIAEGVLASGTLVSAAQPAGSDERTNELVRLGYTRESLQAAADDVRYALANIRRIQGLPATSIDARARRDQLYHWHEHLAYALEELRKRMPPKS